MRRKLEVAICDLKLGRNTQKGQSEDTGRESERDMEIKATISISEKEFIKSNLYLQRKAMIWVPLSAFILSLVVCCGIGILFQKIDIVNFCVPAIGGIVMTPVVPLTTFLAAKKAWKSNALAGESTNCTFSDAGIYMESKTGAGNIGYDTIHKASENQTVFYIHLSTALAWIIPKRCFENAEDIQAVRELFIKNIPPKKVRLMKAS